VKYKPFSDKASLMLLTLDRYNVSILKLFKEHGSQKHRQKIPETQNHTLIPGKPPA
jgi:hypothetical protein